MTQREVDRSVARATGEPVHTVRMIGFRILGEPVTEGFRKPVYIVRNRAPSKKERSLNDRKGNT